VDASDHAMPARAVLFAGVWPDGRGVFRMVTRIELCIGIFGLMRLCMACLVEVRLLYKKWA